jgi:phosphate transport system permease protein
MSNLIREMVRSNLKKRYQAEQRFRLYGFASVGFGLLCLALLFGDIIYKGVGAFRQTAVEVELYFDPEILGLNVPAETDQIRSANFDGIIRLMLRERFPEVTTRADRRALYGLLSVNAVYDLQALVMANPELIGQSRKIWLLADDDVDMYYKYGREGEQVGRLAKISRTWVEQLADDGVVKTQFNTGFFTNGDSRDPEISGVKGAVMGSFFTLMVTFIISFPIGVAAAIYMEEFAPKNKLTDFIEVNINNLAAVPSIIFGLLGLAVFINFFGVPRSVPLVGGLVLSLMTLPTVIISSRASITAVPPSIREAALGIGASKVQVVLHHVLPLAMPGMLTGAIIGMARALGETAPLLMIGMIAFIIDPPSSVLDPATALPVQIYLWADSPERAFTERTSAAIMVLLAFLIVMNSLAVWLRRRLETRW